MTVQYLLWVRGDALSLGHQGPHQNHHVNSRDSINASTLIINTSREHRISLQNLRDTEIH